MVKTASTRRTKTADLPAQDTVSLPRTLSQLTKDELLVVITQLQTENAQVNQRAQQVAAVNSRLRDTLLVLQDSPRPIVNTTLGPVEATADGLAFIAGKLAEAQQKG